MRSRKLSLLAVPAALVLGGLIFWMGEPHDTEADAQTRQEIDRLRSEMTELKRQQAAQRLLAAQSKDDGPVSAPEPEGRSSRRSNTGRASAGSIPCTTTSRRSAPSPPSRFSAMTGSWIEGRAANPRPNRDVAGDALDLELKVTQ